MTRHEALTRALVSTMPVGTVLKQALVQVRGNPSTLAALLAEMPEAADGNADWELTPWDRTVHQIQSSADPRRRNSIYVGRHLPGDHRILIPDKALLEHVHVTGGSGQRKTSLILTPWAVQLIRMLRGELDEGRRGRSIVYFDLKGDPATAAGLRLECARLGIRFQAFSLTPGHATHLFNPLLQRHWGWMDLADMAQSLFSAMGLDYGSGYGRAHFTLLPLEIFATILQECPHALSFRQLTDSDLKKVCKLMGIAASDASDLLAVIRLLADVQALNRAPRSRHEAECSPLFRNAIDMSDVVTQPTVVYFFLQTFTRATVSRIVAKLAIYCLLAAQVFHHFKPERLRRRWPPLPVYCFIDEFQQAATEDLAHAIAQARSFETGILMAHQAFEDIDKENIQILQQVMVNSRTKIRLSARSTVERQLLQDASGVTRRAEYVYSFDVFDEPDGYKMAEPEQPRFHTNTLIEALDDYRTGVVEMSPSADLYQFAGFPQLVRFEHHITLDRYQQLARCDWLAKSPETIVNSIRRRTTFISGGGTALPPPGAKRALRRASQKAADTEQDMSATPAQQRVAQVARSLKHRKEDQQS